MNIRERRIRELQEAVKGLQPETIDSILLHAKKMYPFVRPETLKSYSIAVLELSKARTV